RVAAMCFHLFLGSFLLAASTDAGAAVIDGGTEANQVFQASGRLLLVILAAIFFLTNSASAQQKLKLRPLRIALPSNTIGATHYYVGKSLGIFESYGFEPQILVLEPRAALAALLTGDLDFYTATGITTRAALRGVPVRVILVGLNRPDHALVAAKEITSVEQLRGKVLGGYTAQATVNVILTELMRRKGLRPDEIQDPKRRHGSSRRAYQRQR